MKKLALLIIFSLCCNIITAQEWIDDASFDTAIAGSSGFDDDREVVVIEFYANFNKDNAFKDWEKLKGVKYYRVDIAKAPAAKKKYRIRMAPTLIIFDKEGYKFKVFKAGLDLLCPVQLPALQAAVEQSKKESQF